MGSFRSLALATASALLVACSAIAGLKSLEFAPDDATTDGAGGDDQSPTTDGPNAGDGPDTVDSPATFDAATPFCATVDARVCTDFDDDAAAGQPWRTALPSSQAVGIGTEPIVTTDPGQADRGPYLVTSFVPDASAPNPGYHVSARYRKDDTPGWDAGLAPARHIEVKLYVQASDPTTTSSVVSTDGVPMTVALACAGGGADCAVIATRFTQAQTLADLSVPPKTWVRLAMDIPAFTADDAGIAYPLQFDVTLDVPGRGSLTKTATFTGRIEAPATATVDVGLNHSNPDEGAWEIWYDDVAVTY